MQEHVREVVKMWAVDDSNRSRDEIFPGKNFSFLNFGYLRSGWRKLTSDDVVSEVALAVRSVTERFVGGLAATAEAD